MNRLVREIVHHNSIVQIRTRLDFDPAERFVIIDPSARPVVYHGLLDDPAIQPIRTGGTWFPGQYEGGDR